MGNEALAEDKDPPHTVISAARKVYGPHVEDRPWKRIGVFVVGSEAKTPILFCHHPLRVGAAKRNPTTRLATILFGKHAFAYCGACQKYYWGEVENG